MSTSNTRDQVMAQIVEFMIDAEKSGQDPVQAAQFAFPGTPETVLWTAWSKMEDRTTEVWWQSVEKTIDGEIIRNALATRSA